MAGRKKQEEEQLEKQMELSVEESFAQLEDMVRKMESPDITLESSFSLYEQGMNLLKNVNTRLEEVEEKIRLIDENSQVTGELDGKDGSDGKDGPDEE